MKEEYDDKHRELEDSGYIHGRGKSQYINKWRKIGTGEKVYVFRFNGEQ